MRAVEGASSYMKIGGLINFLCAKKDGSHKKAVLNVI